LPLLEVENLKMYYEILGGRWVQAVDGISFELEKGECLGLVGESGCGKSSVAQTMLRILPSNGRIMDGKVFLNGVDLLGIPMKDFRKNVRWKKISMVFQGSMSSLNPLIRVGDQISEAITVHEDVSKGTAWKRVEELLSWVGLEPKRAKQYPFEFSGGMKQRIVIAMALALGPDLLIADEPTTALDVIVQAQTLGLIKRLQKEIGLSQLIISHDVSLISQISNYVAVMYAGKIVEKGPVKEVFITPVHPYTKLLLSSIPDIKGTRKTLKSVPGSPPDLLNPPSGCRFRPRCSHAIEECAVKEPLPTFVNAEHSACCHRTNEMR